MAARLINCPKCGATIDAAAAEAGTPIECTFCGSSIAFDAPRPHQPTPQIQIFVTPPGPSGYAPRRSNGSAVIGLIAGVLVLVIGGAVAFSALHTAGVAPKIAPTLGLGKTKLPAECPINGTITIEDQDVKVEDTAIKASINCKIIVRHSTIRAHTVIEAGTNAEITIDDSTLIAEGTAIDAGPNAKLKITGKSVIKAEDTAIKASTNGEIRLDGAQIESEDTAIDGSINAHLNARGSKITGKTAALNFSMNADVSLYDTTITGAKNLGMNGKLKEK